MDAYMRLRALQFKNLGTQDKNTQKFQCWQICYGNKTSTIKRQIATEQQANELKLYCILRGMTVHEVKKEWCFSKPQNIVWRHRQSYQRLRSIEGIPHDKLVLFEPILV